MSGQVTLYQKDSVLPLAQVICTQVYEQVQRRLDRTVHMEDVAAVGGIEGGMRRHVENLLIGHLPEEEHDAIRRLLSKLYLRQPDARPQDAARLPRRCGLIARPEGTTMPIRQETSTGTRYSCSTWRMSRSPHASR